MPETVYILPAEFVGNAKIDNGVINVGGIEIHIGRDRPETVGIYVRRYSNDLSVGEIALAFHDGLSQEALDAQNEEAARYVLGPKEYWRGEMVGKYTYGSDSHLMTDKEFEADWED